VDGNVLTKVAEEEFTRRVRRLVLAFSGVRERRQRSADRSAASITTIEATLNIGYGNGDRMEKDPI